MIVKDISLLTPQENILYDDVLLQLAEEGKSDEVLRFWESPTFFIVLGRVSHLEDDVRVENILTHQIPIVRRSSGGGTVLQGPGCLNFSLILSKENNPLLSDLTKSYQYILSRVVESLKLCGIDAQFYPICDIALTQTHKKISGNAQRRLRKFILHHGTILCHFDLNCIEKFLKMPKQMPDYRLERKHLDFVANVHISIEQIKSAFINLWPTMSNLVNRSLNEQEARMLQHLIATKNVLVSLEQNK